MNKALSHAEHHQRPRHGSTKSYVIGFALSLLFTLIPYYLVVHKSVSGTSLLAVILAFAATQLVIQVVFFLHLGRERKPRFNLVFLIGTVGAVLTVTGASVWIMYHLQANMPETEVTQKLADDESISQVGGKSTGGCQGTNVNHQVIIIKGNAFPGLVKAHLCDSLTFTNDDSETRYIAFGNHPRHIAYAGNIGQSLYKGKSWTITLSQQGTYKFHDHLHPQTNGTFTVTP